MWSPHLDVAVAQETYATILETEISNQHNSLLVLRKFKGITMNEWLEKNHWRVS